MCILERRTRALRGFTLVELIAFIVIVGIAVAGVLTTYEKLARDSPDPLVKKQALAVAESMLEEIQQMPFTYCDPDDTAVYSAASTADCRAASTCVTTSTVCVRFQRSTSTPASGASRNAGIRLAKLTTPRMSAEWLRRKTSQLVATRVIHVPTSEML